MDIKDLLPEQDEQMFICGMKGAGKTTFVKNLIRPIAKKQLVIIIDSKPEWENLVPMFGNGEYHKLNPRFLFMLRKESTRGIYVYQCDPNVKAHSDKNVDKIIRWAIARGKFKKKRKKPNCTIYVDEFGDFSKGHTTSYMMDKLLRQSRSKNIRLIIGTQRPSGIDLKAITEARTFVVMTLQHLADRKRMAQEVHPYMLRMVEPLQLWFYRTPKRGEKPKIYLITQAA